MRRFVLPSILWLSPLVSAACSVSPAAPVAVDEAALTEATVRPAGHVAFTVRDGVVVRAMRTADVAVLDVVEGAVDDGASDRVLASLPINLLSPSDLAPLVVTPSHVHVIHAYRGKHFRVDRASGEVTEREVSRSGFGDVVADGDTLYALDRWGERILRLEPASSGWETLYEPARDGVALSPPSRIAGMRPWDGKLVGFDPSLGIFAFDPTTRAFQKLGAGGRGDAVGFTPERTYESPRESVLIEGGRAFVSAFGPGPGRRPQCGLLANLRVVSVSLVGGPDARVDLDASSGGGVAVAGPGALPLLVRSPCAGALERVAPDGSRTVAIPVGDHIDGLQREGSSWYYTKDSTGALVRAEL